MKKYIIASAAVLVLGMSGTVYATNQKEDWHDRREAVVSSPPAPESKEHKDKEDKNYKNKHEEKTEEKVVSKEQPVEEVKVVEEVEEVNTPVVTQETVVPVQAEEFEGK